MIFQTNYAIKIARLNILKGEFINLTYICLFVRPNSIVTTWNGKGFGAPWQKFRMIWETSKATVAF
jgi:hypothetical protein